VGVGERNIVAVVEEEVEGRVQVRVWGGNRGGSGSGKRGRGNGINRKDGERREAVVIVGEYHLPLHQAKRVTHPPSKRRKLQLQHHLANHLSQRVQ
jgi:hypothetical protein